MPCSWVLPIDSGLMFWVGGSTTPCREVLHPGMVDSD